MGAAILDEGRMGTLMTRFALVLLLSASMAFALEGLPSLHQPLTLVLDAEKPLPEESLVAMRAELDRLFEKSQLKLALKHREEIGLGQDVSDLVLVRFKGECRIQPEPVYLDERGPQPLAMTHVTDGRVLPFSEVRCERVRKAARSAMWGGEVANSESLMGRALARVIAHELFHILTQDCGHSHHGVFQKGLTGKQLIDENLEFRNGDLARIRRRTPGP